MQVKKGDKVKVEYEGRLEDGTVFDSSMHGDHSHPLEFEAGSGMVIPGFDNAVMGMSLEEEKEVIIHPSDAYGEHDASLFKKIPRKGLPQDHEPKAGMILLIKTPDGRQFPVKITEVNDEDVTIDLNHPLAGKTLIFKLKIVGIN